MELLKIPMEKRAKTGESSFSLLSHARRLIIIFPVRNILICLLIAFILIPTSSFPAVDPLSGSFYINQTDLMLTFRSIQLDISRSFDSHPSLSAPRNSPWVFHPFDKRLVLTEDLDPLVLYDGEELVIFRKADDDKTFISENGEKVTIMDNQFVRFLRDGDRQVYDREGRLSRIIYPDGSALMLLYDGKRLQRISSQHRELLRYLYNQQGRIKKIEAFNGASSSYSYDKNSLLAEAVNEENLKTSYEYDESGKLISVRFQTGDFVRVAYDGESGLVKSIIKKGGVTRYAYEMDKDGTITKATITHPTGVETIATENNGTVIKHTDVMGHVTENHFEDGRLVQHLDTKGHYAKFAYDSLGRLISITNPEGGKTRYTYVGNTSLLSKESFPDGSTFQYVYNEKRQVAKILGPGGSELSFRYNDLGLVDSESYGKARRFYRKYSYDEMGFLVRESDSLGRTVEYDRDGRGRVVELVDELGKRWKYEYDNYGFVTKISDSTRTVATNKYNDGLRLVQSRDERGLSTFYSYDDRGNLKSVRYPKGTGETYDYDPYGRLKSVLDSKGNRWSSEYNQFGLVTEEVGPDGATIRYGYDPFGNLTEMVDPYGHVTRWQYDGMDRVMGIVSPGEISQKYSFDALGRPISEKDALGNVKRYAYDGSGNLIKTVLPNGEEFSYAYDTEDLGNLISATASDGRKYMFEYDPGGRVIAEKEPWGETIQYFYGRGNNSVKQVSSNGNSISYKYDASGRFTELESSDGDMEEFKYDVDGNLTKIVGRDFEKNLFYNEFGELISEEYPLLGIRIGYTYDEWGNRTSLAVPGVIKIDYSYDDLGRLAAIRFNNDRIIQISYDKLGRKTLVSYPNGIKVKYSYDGRNFLSSIAFYSSAGKVIGKFQYEYTKAGKLSKIIDQSGNTRAFSYDTNGQLARVSSNNAETIIEYGPCLKRVAEIKDGKRKSFRYNRAGQLTKADETTLTYDSAGHRAEKITSGIKTSYHFDALGRLTRARTPTYTIQYGYSPEGQRISKKVGDRITYYIYDGFNLLMELDDRKRPAELFIHAEEVDSPLVMLKGNESFFYLPDHLGSITAVADEAGAIVCRYTYDPFGVVTVEGKDPGNPFAFTARFFDKESGLYNYRARYYDPELGLFVSPDPYEKSLEFPKTFNDYAYADNDPVNVADPLGLSTSFEGNFWRPLIRHIPKRLLAEYCHRIFIKPRIIFPGQDVNATEFWNQVGRDYAWLRENYGPGTAEEFRQNVNRKMIQYINKRYPPKPGMWTRASERGKRLLESGKRLLKRGYRAVREAPGRAQQYVKVRMRPQTRIVPRAPSTESTRGVTHRGPAEQLTETSTNVPGKPSFWTRPVGLLERGFWVTYAVAIAWRVGSRYAAEANAEGRHVNWKDAAKSGAESSARATLAVATSGISELAIAGAGIVNEGVEKYKARYRQKKAEEKLAQLRSSKQMGARMARMVGQTTNFVNQADAIKAEQEAAIKNAKDWSMSTEKHAREVEKLQSAIANHQTLCNECKAKIEALATLQAEMRQKRDALMEHSSAAKDKATLVCKDPTAEAAQAHVDEALHAAESAKKILGELADAGDRARMLEQELKECTARIQENSENIPVELDIKENSLTINTKMSWDYALRAKRCSGECERLRARLYHINLVTDGMTDSRKVIISQKLAEITKICRQVASNATKGETYAIEAESLAKSTIPKIKALKAKFEAVKSCEVKPSPGDLAEELEAASHAAATYVSYARTYAEEARECLASRPKGDKPPGFVAKSDVKTKPGPELPTKGDEPPGFVKASKTKKTQDVLPKKPPEEEAQSGFDPTKPYQVKAISAGWKDRKCKIKTGMSSYVTANILDPSKTAVIVEQNGVQYTIQKNPGDPKSSTNLKSILVGGKFFRYVEGCGYVGTTKFKNFGPGITQEGGAERRPTLKKSRWECIAEICGCEGIMGVYGVGEEQRKCEECINRNEARIIGCMYGK